MLLTSHSIAALSTVPWSLWGVENVVDGSGHSRGAAREEMNDPWQGQSGQESPVVIAPAHKDIHLGYCWGGEREVVSKGSTTATVHAGCCYTEGGRRGNKTGRAMVVGDSIGKGSDSCFCVHRIDSRLVCCLHGARIQDVSE